MFMIQSPLHSLHKMKNLAYLLIFGLIAFPSCSSKVETSETITPADPSLTEVVELTPDQVKSLSVVTNPLESRALSRGVQANGMLDVPPQNLVTISAPMGGFVKQTELLQGMKVNKGQVVAIMEHPDYIQLQQDYLDGKSQLEFLELEYKRQEELAKENVNAAKALQQARSNYLSMKAKVEGWHARLELINVNAEAVEKNGIQSAIKLISPITGYVTQVHVNIGMFVNPNDIMFKIVDSDHLHAEITIFEKDVSKLRVGQLVRFTLANETQERLASIYLIGKEISGDRTVRVHGHLKKEDTSLLPGMFFSAIIETGPQNVSSLPDAAIVNFQGKSFVFVARGENKFELTQVTTGLQQGGFTEIAVSAELANALFVTTGAYDLLSMLKNASEED
jgi:membrane fusion protein, heavy metal efflux system